MKGIVITTMNEIVLKDFDEPLYKTVGAVVGGYIEIVHPRGLPDPYCMIVNEEGLMLQLPFNTVGSMLYGTLVHGNPIVGDLVIMKTGYVNGEPDIVGLEEREADALYSQFLTQFQLKGTIKNDQKSQ